MTYHTQGKFAFGETPRAIAGPFAFNALSARSPLPAGRVYAVSLAGWVGQLPTRALREATCRAEITLGGGGDEGGSAGETFLVDYPCQGTVIQVHARDISVVIRGTVQQADLNGQRNPPLLQGWLTPGPAKQRLHPPTLTEALGVFPPTTAAQLNIPSRARAYRLFTLTDEVAFQVLQQSSNATPVDLAEDHPGTALGGASLPASRSGWIPLHPHAAVVVLENQDAVATATVCMQWLLDLG